MERHALDRLQGESDREYLDRLKAMDPTDWSVDDRMAHALSVRNAERSIAARLRCRDATHAEESLQQVKRLVGRLSPRQRHQLSQWIARGMQLRPAGEEGQGVGEDRRDGKTG